jgi:hypothetical protein
MEQEKILMGQKQLQRWHLMKMVEVGKITLKEAGERIGVSYRQCEKGTVLFLETKVKKKDKLFLGFVGFYGSFGFLALVQS